MRISLRLPLALLALALAAPFASAQAMPAPPTTHVLTILTVKPGAPMDQMSKTMPDEVRETVRLYLNGKIEQWYALAEGRGVVFVLNCTTVAEAQAMMDSLPLGKAKLADFQFMPLAPLTPLRYLLGPAGAPPAKP